MKKVLANGRCGGIIHRRIYQLEEERRDGRENEIQCKGDGKKLITAIMMWAQMPYEEGGAK